MKRRKTFVSAVLLGTMMLAACGGGGGGGGQSCESPLAISGTWSGTINDSGAGGGALVTVFEQSDCALGGTWSVRFRNDPASDGSGSLIGSTDRQAISFKLLTQAAGSCGYQAEGSLSGANEIAASYSTFGANCAASGTIDILRQSTPTLTPTPTITSTPTRTPIV